MQVLSQTVLRSHSQALQLESVVTSSVNIQTDRDMKNDKGYKVNIQTQYGRKTFLFKMSRHFTGPDHDTMTKIAEWTAKNSDNQNWLVGHLLVYSNGKIARITPNHDLWNLLNRTPII